METQRQSRTVAAGAQIFREGDVGDCTYIIRRGRVKISAYRLGQEMTLAELGDGEVFGEVALIDAGPRSASAIAMEETELLAIRGSRLSETLERADPLLGLMLRILADRFREAQGRVGIPRGACLPSSPDSTAYDDVRRLAFERIQVEQDLRQALESQEFELHYQPIVSLVTGLIAGFEALIRWRRPGLGLLPPAQFIPLAEETGMINEIGSWALEEALRTHSGFVDRFRTAFPYEPLPHMSVNLSAGQLGDLSDVRILKEAIAAGGLDPALVKLELTESLLIRDPELATTILEELKALGVSLAIDDFGTGYSSLSYLHQFPFDTLKIDRSFVAGMRGQEGSLRIVRSIVAMARELQMSIVAEGIEDEQQCELLRDLGCECGQGYLFAKPGPQEEIEHLLDAKASW